VYDLRQKNYFEMFVCTRISVLSISVCAITLNFFVCSHISVLFIFSLCNAFAEYLITVVLKCHITSKIKMIKEKRGSHILQFGGLLNFRNVHISKRCDKRWELLAGKFGVYHFMRRVEVNLPLIKA
jgi:hypothetical protein